LLNRGEVSVSFLRASLSPKSYFPPVWFAEADDSHLTDDERAKTEQGATKNWLKLEPLQSAEVPLTSYGARAFTGDLSVESGTTSEVFTFTSGALARTGQLTVTSSSVVTPSGSCARSGSMAPATHTSACYMLTGRSARAGTHRPTVNTDNTARMRTNFAIAQSREHLPCLTVHNPTDEELVSWYLHHRRFDMLTSKWY
jgi:hypothetical protein